MNQFRCWPFQLGVALFIRVWKGPGGLLGCPRTRGLLGAPLRCLSIFLPASKDADESKHLFHFHFPTTFFLKPRVGSIFPSVSLGLLASPPSVIGFKALPFSSVMLLSCIPLFLWGSSLNFWKILYWISLLVSLWASPLTDWGFGRVTLDHSADSVSLCFLSL